MLLAGDDRPAAAHREPAPLRGHNAYRGEKEIEVYPFNGHEGGVMFQEAAQLRWVPKALNSAV